MIVLAARFRPLSSMRRRSKQRIWGFSV